MKIALSSSCLITSLFVAFALFATPFAALAQPQVCGPAAAKDIVIMLDLSGSQSAATIAQQKAAGLVFINAFASYAVKPNIAVASFNSSCNCSNAAGSIDPCDGEEGASAVDCYNNPSLIEARVDAPLSRNYTLASQKLAVGSGIVGQGPDGRGKGGSNLKRAIEVVQAHLAAAGNSAYANNLVLLSDGQTNLPGYYLVPLAQCDNCACPIAQVPPASQAAQTARSAGTTIFTAFSSPAPCGNGASFLQNQIASNPSYHFSAPSSISLIMPLLTDQLTCNDGLSCTVDSCVSGVCQFVSGDSDGDGVNNCNDQCVGNNSLIGNPCDGADSDNCASGIWQCPIGGSISCSDDAAVDDSDGDGVPNCIDQCSGNNTLIGQACDGSDADTCASGVWQCPSGGSLACSDNPQLDDSDGDGVPNRVDQCNGNNALIGQACDGSDADTCASGVWQCPSGGSLACSDNPQLDDSDGDGSPNCIDQCPNDPAKTTPGACGCGIPNTDSDNDGAPNYIDQCPNDSAKTLPGACGCGVPNTDSDGDGVPNCIDQCSNDPSKASPGTCGCGIADTDSNGNGVPDCNDVGSTALCTRTDVQGYINALSSTVNEQNGQITRLTRRISLVRARCPSLSAANTFVMNTNRTSTKLRAANRNEIAKLPLATLSCPSSAGCANSVITFGSSLYTKNSSSFRRLVDQILAYDLTCTRPGGVCEGTARECADRAKERERIRRSERAAARRLDSANKTTVSQLPSTTAVCS